MNQNVSTFEEIEKIFQILLSNQNKINFLRNSKEINQGINKFLNGLDIDIKNILSLLDRIKFGINQNMNKDIIICGNCDCCKFCNCSTNNCSENQNNMSNDYNPNNDYIKEIINQDENLNNDFNLPPNYNYLNNNVCKDLYSNDNLPNFNNMNNLTYNLNCNNNQTAEEKFKNSAVMKSKRFYANKSYDNLIQSPIRKAKIIRHYNPTEINSNLNNFDIPDNNNIIHRYKKNIKINKAQKLLNLLMRQPKDIINRFKNIYGVDIEQKLLNNKIGNNDLTEMENILNKIIKMSIWGEDIRKKSEEKNKKKRIKFKYNPIQEKVKLKQAITNKQTQYKEYPRGWNSTKEYFINNGTSINNDNALYNTFI